MSRRVCDPQQLSVFVRMTAISLGELEGSEHRGGSSQTGQCVLGGPRAPRVQAVGVAEPLRSSFQMPSMEAVGKDQRLLDKQIAPPPSASLITTEVSTPHRHHWLVRPLLSRSDAPTHLHSAGSLGQEPI